MDQQSVRLLFRAWCEQQVTRLGGVVFSDGDLAELCVCEDAGRRYESQLIRVELVQVLDEWDIFRFCVAQAVWRAALSWLLVFLARCRALRVLRRGCFFGMY